MTNLTRSNFQAMGNPRGGLIVLCLFFIFSLFLAGFFSFEFKSFLTILPSEVLYAMIGIVYDNVDTDKLKIINPPAQRKQAPTLLPPGKERRGGCYAGGGGRIEEDLVCIV